MEHHVANLVVGQARGDTDQRWKLGRASGTVRSMTARAILAIESRPSDRFCGAEAPRNQPHDPGHLIRIDIQNSGCRIPGRTAPLRASIHSRKENGSFTAGRCELRAATQPLKL